MVQSNERLVCGGNKNANLQVFMERTGIEPVTSGLQTQPIADLT
jgi:hypothetical protein